MGASYLAGIANFSAARADRWSIARVQMPAIIVFTSAQLAATLLHLDIFDWDHPVAWAWLAVYVVRPPAAIAVYVAHERAARPDAGGGRPPPRFAAPAFAVPAAISLAFCVAVFAVPDRLDGVWPWSLTPLTGRVIGGWLLSAAALYVIVARQRTVERTAIGLARRPS
jgi:hypothetical protein